jgi:hypothetical protein
MIAYNARSFFMNSNSNSNIISERADILISHVVDGESNAEQWRELEALAAQDPRIWRELAEMQRDAAALRSAMRCGGDIAERIGLPAKTAVAAPIGAGATGGGMPEQDIEIRTFRHPHHPQAPQLRLNRLGTWTGWAAAAVITIIASVQLSQKQNVTGGNTPVVPATLGGPIAQSAGELFDQYLATGQKDGTVLGEVPGKMLVESRPAPSGQGFEIIFVRQVVERAIVPDLYKIDGVDDRGQATLARYRQPVRKTM